MRILIVEDNPKIHVPLQDQLRKEGFQVDIAENGEDGLYYICQRAHDLVLLDRMLPLMDGLEVLKRMRQQNIPVPVILVTALGEVSDKVDGLDTGADDYLVKPFDFQELMARIRCLQRRPASLMEDTTLTYGDIVLNEQQSQLTGSSTCSLSQKEAQMLQLFIRYPEKTLPRSMILTGVWGPDADVEDGNIDNYIFLLRRKLKAVDSRLQLKTVHRVGYRLEDSYVS